MNFIRRHFYYLLLLLLLSSLFVWYAFSLNNYCPIKVVKLKGSYRHVQEDTLKTLLLSALPHSMLSFKLPELERTLKKIEWINAVSIKRIWPDTLLVRFSEYEPVVNWCDNGVLTSDGLFIKAGPKDRLNIPLSVNLCGPVGSEQTALTYYHLFQEILAAKDLKILSVTLSDRYAWRLTLYEHLTIKLGRAQMLARLNNLMAHYAILNKVGSAAAVLDLRYPNGVALRKGKDSKGSEENNFNR